MAAAAVAELKWSSGAAGAAGAAAAAAAAGAATGCSVGEKAYSGKAKQKASAGLLDQS